jgi:chromosome segregation ATPase
MLIGPTFTLEKLEQHMKNKIDENKMRLTQLSKEYAKIKQELQVTPKTTVDENGNKITNDHYVKLFYKLKELEGTINEIHDENEFLIYRIDELEQIEERSSGKIRKDRDKITLTLADCLKLGITLQEETEENK